MKKNSYGHRPNAPSNRERCFTLDWPDNGAGVDGIFVREEGTRMQLVARSAVHEIVPAGWFSTASQRVRHQDTVLQTVAICAFDATSLLPGSWQVTRPTAAEPLARAAVSVAGWRGNRRAPVPYLPELMAALAQRGRRE